MCGEGIGWSGNALHLLDPTMRQILARTLKAIKDGRTDDLVALLRNSPSLFTKKEIGQILQSAGDVPLLTLQALLDHGWNINEPQSFAMPPFLADIVEDEAAVRWFLDQGADPNAYAGIYRSTPLSWAAQYAPLRNVELLLERGGAVDRGELVNFAIARPINDPDAIPILRLLLSNGAPADHVLYEQYPDLKDLTMFQTTPLASCCANGKADAAELLIQYGANLWKTAPMDNRLAIEVARQNGHQNIVDMLQRAMQSSPRL